MKNKVKKLYALGSARWYDSFKPAWNYLVASKAEKQLGLFLKNNTGGNKSVLELGCGTALNLKKIGDLKRYLGLDFSPDMLKIAKGKFSTLPNVKFQQKDITKLDDINEKFDIIICTWVLSHLQNPARVVNQAQRLLSRNGKFFIIFFTVPKWYLNFWLYPIAKYLFRSRCVSEETIKKFNNVKTRQSFSANITTVIEIHK